jgi:hypothetical protein
VWGPFGVPQIATTSSLAARNMLATALFATPLPVKAGGIATAGLGRTAPGFVPAVVKVGSGWRRSSKRQNSDKRGKTREYSQKPLHGLPSGKTRAQVVYTPKVSKRATPLVGARGFEPPTTCTPTEPGGARCARKATLRGFVVDDDDRIVREDRARARNMGGNGVLVRILAASLPPRPDGVLVR